MKNYRYWLDISYLRTGNERQKKAYEVLQVSKMMEHLSRFDPILVGTIPIDIDLEQSDLDIICEVDNFEEFERFLEDSYSDFHDFRLHDSVLDGDRYMVANFIYQDFCFEIFGQAMPTVKQNAFLHMVIESRLLELAGEDAREQIRRLKRDGLKTEPAFAAYFNLEGDPYKVLLELGHASDEELRQLIHTSKRCEV